MLKKTKHGRYVEDKGGRAKSTQDLKQKGLSWAMEAISVRVKVKRRKEMFIGRSPPEIIQHHRSRFFSGHKKNPTNIKEIIHHFTSKKVSFGLSNQLSTLTSYLSESLLLKASGENPIYSNIDDIKIRQ